MLFLPSVCKRKLIKWFCLPSATTRELAASHPIEACRRETEDICRCRVRAREFVPGASLHAGFQVVARHPRTALDWHSSLLLINTHFSIKFTFLCCNLQMMMSGEIYTFKVPTYTSIAPLITQLMASRCLAHLWPDLNFPQTKIWIFLFLALLCYTHTRELQNWLAQFPVSLLDPIGFLLCFSFSSLLHLWVDYSMLFTGSGEISGFHISPTARNSVDANPIMLQPGNGREKRKKSVKKGFFDESYLIQFNLLSVRRYFEWRFDRRLLGQRSTS